MHISNIIYFSDTRETDTNAYLLYSLTVHNDTQVHRSKYKVIISLRTSCKFSISHISIKQKCCQPVPEGTLLLENAFVADHYWRNLQWCAKYYFQNSILFWKYKIVCYFVFLKYSYQCILFCIFKILFFKYFVILKILFLKILSAKAKLKANLSVTEIRSF